MPTKRAPNCGSLQYWPRKRAKRSHARVRSVPTAKETQPLMFAGYKAGMTHVMVTENRQHSPSKGKTVAMTVTVVECPPIKIFGAVAYTKDMYGKKARACVFADKMDKALARIITFPKKPKKKLMDIKAGDITELRLLAHTQPGLTSIGSKTPEIFELPLGGKPAEQLAYAKDVLGKDITVNDVIKTGMQLDTHAVTTGRGFQGPVKRFGIGLRSHKAEKTKRGPGSLGAWTGPRSWTVAHAGQTGYHSRAERNKWVLHVSDDIKTITPNGGFLRYGTVRNSYILLKGSIPGPRKRLIKFTHAFNPNKSMPGKTPAISIISRKSQQ